MEQVINRSTAARRFNLLLLGGFAAIALALAAHPDLMRTPRDRVPIAGAVYATNRALTE
jgi:hypothetical protein